MNENKTLIKTAQEWWQDNNKVIKAGIACGLAGLAYGFIKGMVASNDMWLDHGFSNALDGIQQANRSEPLRLTENNCDEPDVLVRVEIENNANS